MFWRNRSRLWATWWQAAATKISHDVLQWRNARNFRERSRGLASWPLSSQSAGIVKKYGWIVINDLLFKHIVFQEMTKAHGGKILDAEPVLSIEPGSPVTVTTSKARYQATSVVVTAGAWTSKLLKPLGVTLPLRVRHAQYLLQMFTHLCHQLQFELFSSPPYLGISILKKGFCLKNFNYCFKIAPKLWN